MRISDWSSDVCSSDLVPRCYQSGSASPVFNKGVPAGIALQWAALEDLDATSDDERFGRLVAQTAAALEGRSEEHTSELQSLMRISYAVFCLKKKKKKITTYTTHDDERIRKRQQTTRQ